MGAKKTVMPIPQEASTLKSISTMPAVKIRPALKRLATIFVADQSRLAWSSMF